jgi:Enoyl-CoA hydratase/isomerase
MRQGTDQDAAAIHVTASSFRSPMPSPRSGQLTADGGTAEVIVLPGLVHEQLWRYGVGVSYALGIDYRNLLVTADTVAARITLNRPDKRNALSLELMRELIAALREVSTQTPARAIVIEGAGPAFSAGHDLSEMIGRDVLP